MRGMACMRAEIDQMDLAERRFAARRFLDQFESGTEIGKPLQIAAAQIGRGLIAIAPGGDIRRIVREFRDQRRIDIEAGADDQKIMQPGFILTRDLHRDFPTAREAVSIAARKWIWKPASRVVRLTVSCGTGDWRSFR